MIAWAGFWVEMGGLPQRRSMVRILRSRRAVAMGGWDSLKANWGGLPAGRATSREGMRKGGREDECGSVTGF